MVKILLLGWLFLLLPESPALLLIDTAASFVLKLSAGGSSLPSLPSFSRCLLNGGHNLLEEKSLSPFWLVGSLIFSQIISELRKVRGC